MTRSKASRSSLPALLAPLAALAWFGCVTETAETEASSDDEVDETSSAAEPIRADPIGADLRGMAEVIPPPTGRCDAQEQEPNDQYQSAKQLPNGTTCGSSRQLGDDDWYVWSVPGSGVQYDLRVSGSDTEVYVWKYQRGRYYRVKQSTAQQVTKTSVGAGKYYALVWNPSGAICNYSLRFKRSDIVPAPGGGNSSGAPDAGQDTSNPGPNTDGDAGRDTDDGTGRQPSIPSGDYDYSRDIEWEDVPTHSWSGNSYGSTYFTDIFRHTNDRFTSSDNPGTNAHETLHGLNHQMRIKRGNGWNFVYHENGRGAYVREPSMDAARIRDYVPSRVRTLADMRYKTYLVDQISDWHEVLYQFDEWSCYRADARIAVEIAKAGQWNFGMIDQVDGAMDFVAFGSAAVLALKQNEPSYLQNKQFKAVFAMLAEQSMQYIDEGLTYRDFSRFHAKELRDVYRTSSEMAPTRAAIKEWMGSAWTKRVLGF